MIPTGHKYSCFFGISKKLRACLITRAEWVKNPDTGIPKLIERYRRENLCYQPCAVGSRMQNHRAIGDTIECEYTENNDIITPIYE